MATDAQLSVAKGQPTVTITAGHPQVYRYTIILRKPEGETWEDGSSGKVILRGKFDKNNDARDAVTIGMAPADLIGHSLEWIVFVKVPGGGTGQYSVTIAVSQGGNVVPGGFFPTAGGVSNTAAVADTSDFIVVE